MMALSGHHDPLGKMLDYISWLLLTLENSNSFGLHSEKVKIGYLPGRKPLGIVRYAFTQEVLIIFRIDYP